MRKLTTRETIIGLLETLHDARETLQSNGEGSEFGDSRLMLLPDIYHKGSYRQLESALVAMRDQEPFSYWHLAETYLRAVRRCTDCCKQCGMPLSAPHLHLVGGKRRRVELERRVVTSVSAAVRPEVVAVAVDWLVAEFDRRSVVPFLPLDVLEVMAA